MGVAPASFTLLALVLTHRRALVSSLWKSVNMGDLAEAKRVVEGLVGEIQAKVDGGKNGSVTDCGGTAGPKSKLKTRRELKATHRRSLRCSGRRQSRSWCPLRRTAGLSTGM